MAQFLDNESGIGVEEKSKVDSVLERDTIIERLVRKESKTAKRRNLLYQLQRPNTFEKYLKQLSKLYPEDPHSPSVKMSLSKAAAQVTSLQMVKGPSKKKKRDPPKSDEFVESSSENEDESPPPAKRAQLTRIKDDEDEDVEEVTPKNPTKDHLPNENEENNEESQEEEEDEEDEEDENGGDGDADEDNPNEDSLLYGTSDESGDEQEILNKLEKKKVKIPCGICGSELSYGMKKNNKEPYLSCPNYEDCKTSWMEYKRALNFHIFAPTVLKTVYRKPFVKGRPRCECNEIMQYVWMGENVEDGYKEILPNRIFLTCAVKKKDGTPCNKVLFAEKNFNKQQDDQMVRYYNQNKLEKVRAQAIAAQDIKIVWTEAKRNKKLNAGLYKKMQNQRTALLARLNQEKKSKQQKKTPNSKK